MLKLDVKTLDALDAFLITDFLIKQLRFQHKRRNHDSGADAGIADVF